MSIAEWVRAFKAGKESLQFIYISQSEALVATF